MADVRTRVNRVRIVLLTSCRWCVSDSDTGISLAYTGQRHNVNDNEDRIVPLPSFDVPPAAPYTDTLSHLDAGRESGDADTRSHQGFAPHVVILQPDHQPPLPQGIRPGSHPHPGRTMGNAHARIRRPGKLAPRRRHVLDPRGLGSPGRWRAGRCHLDRPGERGLAYLRPGSG